MTEKKLPWQKRQRRKKWRFKGMETNSTHSYNMNSFSQTSTLLLNFTLSKFVSSIVMLDFILNELISGTPIIQTRVTRTPR